MWLSYDTIVTFYVYVFCNVSHLLTLPEEGSNKSEILLNHAFAGEGNPVINSHISQVKNLWNKSIEVK